MPSTDKKRVFVGFFLFLLIVSIPLTLLLVSERQETQSRAAGSTTINFAPNSTTSTPIQKNIGETIPLDIMVNPGTNNLVTFVRFQITFDATKLELVSTPFTLNTVAFPVVVEGPVISTGSIAESVSIGSDPTKAIQQPTKIGTLTFRAIGPTGNAPTTASFSALTQALSAGQGDQAGENVLSTTSPAFITVGGSGGGTGTPSGTPAPGTRLNFRILLHGVGSAGDNPNPSNSSLSNKSPLHPQRNLDVQIFDSNNQLVSSVSAPTAISYEGAGGGAFVGWVDLGSAFPSGKYNIKIKTERYLRRLIPGIFTIQTLEDTDIADVNMIAGDVNGDNTLNVLDYNALLDCGFGEVNPLPMADPNAVYNTQTCQAHTPAGNIDLNDNGIINGPDYNLFLRELSVQNGD